MPTRSLSAMLIKEMSRAGYSRPCAQGATFRNVNGSPHRDRGYSVQGGREGPVGVPIATGPSFQVVNSRIFRAQGAFDEDRHEVSDGDRRPATELRSEGSAGWTQPRAFHEVARSSSSTMTPCSALDSAEPVPGGR